MNLYNFENYIDRKILSRGYDYYDNGCVSSVEEIADNVYEAEVEGTDLYTVEVKLDDKENIIYTECNCPYDMGKYCKHQAAVFLALRDIKNKTSVCNNTVKKKKSPDIRKILSDRSKDELVDFLVFIASEYEEIKQRIELDFDIGNQEEEINKSIVLIRTYIKNNSDRCGFVSYGDTHKALKGADMVLEKARNALKQNKLTHAVDLALCVIHEMIYLLNAADDSDGEIGGMIEESFFLINEIIDGKELSPACKESIFDKLLEEASNQRYDGWIDWRVELLENCSKLAYNTHLRNILENHMLSMIKNEKKDPWFTNYFAERVNLIIYRMIEKFDDQKKTYEFIEKNLQYSNFRQKAIEIAIKKKDYERVIKLAEEGEEKDKNLPGLRMKWKEYRYKAFQLSGKIDEQRAIAIDFILNGSFEYYKELKKSYDKKEWPSIYPKIISLLENQNKTHQEVYTRILIEEGEKQKLLDYVKQNPSSVKIFYKYLIPEFKEQVYMIFMQYIEQTASRSNSRKDYQEVCGIIRDLKKAGGKQQVLEIKQRLFAKYSNRPAFRDELSKV